MNTVKREAHSLPTNDQKRRREGSPYVKKINFRRSNEGALTAVHAKDIETQKTSVLNVKRSRRIKRRSSQSSCSESEAGGNRKSGESSKNDGKQPVGKCTKSSTDVVVPAKINYCSTPVGKGNDMPDCAARVSARIQIEQAFGRHVSSPFSAGMKSVVDSSSFFGDDSALADLNLSEIISSTTASDPAQRNNCASIGKEDSKQFYGLPLQVKELIQKYKGIENLYGKK